MNKPLTPDEAALILNVRAERVRELCRAGELTAKIVGRTWQVSSKAVQDRKNTKGKR